MEDRENNPSAYLRVLCESPAQPPAKTGPWGRCETENGPASLAGAGPSLFAGADLYRRTARTLHETGRGPRYRGRFSVGVIS